MTGVNVDTQLLLVPGEVSVQGLESIVSTVRVATTELSQPGIRLRQPVTFIQHNFLCPEHASLHVSLVNQGVLDQDLLDLLIGGVVTILHIQDLSVLFQQHRIIKKWMTFIKVKIISIPIIWSNGVRSLDLTCPTQVYVSWLKVVVALDGGDVDILWLLLVKT